MDIDPANWTRDVDTILRNHRRSTLGFLGVRTDLRCFVDALEPPHRHNPAPHEKRVILFGSVPRRNGTPRMGIEGNRYSQPNHWIGPLKDGECVQDVLILGRPGDEHPCLSELWDRQLHVLSILDSISEDESDDLPIMEAPMRNIGFVKTAIEDGKLVDRIEVVWDKFKTLDPDQHQDSQNVVSSRNASEVRSGAVYSPRVLEHSSTSYTDLKNDVILQHEIFDDNGHLIPPWEILNEFRPGSVVMVIVTLYDKKLPSDIQEIGYYDRVSELRGAWAQVVKRGPGPPSHYNPPCAPPTWRIKREEALAPLKTLLDFPGFGSVKGR